MRPASPAPVVHLELHTRDSRAARSFCADCFGWRHERVQTPAGSYLALTLGGRIDGGIVECPTTRALWLPYVEVQDISERTDRARFLGAEVMLPPREGPTGWRSVVAAPAAGEIALWQPKR
jgi:hypothetical protein